MTARSGRAARHPGRVLQVADVLRRRILDGQVQRGELLPTQEDLAQQFGVGMPTVRSALRILESEGMLEVKRGRIGGAVVLGPGISHTSQTIHALLRSQKVRLHDVGEAIRHFEPVCAALCTARDDRDQVVLPALRRIHDESKRCIEDVERFTDALRRFHESIVSLCGNQAVIVMIGALERIWSEHARVWARERRRAHTFPDLDYRQHAIDDHELLMRLIARGDVSGALREARAHMQWTPNYTVMAPEGDDQMLLDLDLLRGPT